MSITIKLTRISMFELKTKQKGVQMNNSDFVLVD